MVGAGNICEFHVAAVKRLGPEVELDRRHRPRPGRAPRTRAEKWEHDRVPDPRRAGRGRRQRDPRAHAARRPRDGRARRARAGLPRADREADRRGRRRGARDRRARAQRRGSTRQRQPLAALRSAGPARARRRCAPARSARSSSVDILRGSEYPPYEGGPLPPWYRDAGYPFRDIGVHCLYLIQELLGPIEDVEAQWRSLGGDPNLAFDEWRALVRCKRGLGQFQLTYNVKPMQSQLIIHGTKGVLRVDLFAMFHGKRAATPLPKAAERLRQRVHRLDPAADRRPDRRLQVRAQGGPGVPGPARPRRRLLPPARRRRAAAGRRSMMPPHVVRWVEKVARAADADAHGASSRGSSCRPACRSSSPAPRARSAAPWSSGCAPTGTGSACSCAGSRRIRRAGVEYAFGNLGDPVAVDARGPGRRDRDPLSAPR